MTDDPSDIATRSPRRTAPRFASFENEDSADYFVFVDDFVLTQTDGFAKGLNLWFISHYIFNLLKFSVILCHITVTSNKQELYMAGKENIIHSQSRHLSRTAYIK